LLTSAAIQHDINEKQGKAPNADCPAVNGPCESFVGHKDVVLGTYTWSAPSSPSSSEILILMLRGPASGWIILMTSIVFSAITVIIVILIGRSDAKKGYLSL